MPLVRPEIAHLDDARRLDWRWQLRHRLRTPDELAARFELSADHRAELAAGGYFSTGVTPYFADLCAPSDPACPLLRQVLPDPAERHHAPFELVDPLGEDPHRVAPGVVRKYPDRVLLLVTDTCAAYCRYCTRSRWVAAGQHNLTGDELDAAIGWIAAHAEIRDVLISGGDPLLLSTDRLAGLLNRLAAIEHLDLIRIGTRVPVFLPMRIDTALAVALRPRRIPVFVNVHINHHRELAPLVTERLGLLADAGIPLGGQAVLLRGVNDDADTLRETFFAMLRARVRPYYLFHCDPVRGTSHLRVPVSRGRELMAALVGRTSGMAVPKYCIDLPGAGKVPLWPEHVEEQDDGSLVVRAWDGTRHVYPDR